MHIVITWFPYQIVVAQKGYIGKVRQNHREP